MNSNARRVSAPAAAASGHNQYQFVLGRVTHNTHPAILQYFVANDNIAPFPGGIPELHDRMDQPGRDLWYVYDTGEPNRPYSILQTIKAKGIPVSLIDILAGKDLTDNGDADTLAFYSVHSLVLGSGAADFVIDEAAKEITQDKRIVRKVTVSPSPDLREAMKNLPRKARRDMPFELSIGSFKEHMDKSLADESGNYFREITERSRVFRMDFERFVADHTLRMEDNPRGSGKRAKDTVARFHLGRGASYFAANPLQSPHATSMFTTITFFYPSDLDILERNKGFYAAGTPVRSKQAFRLIRGRAHPVSSPEMVWP